MKKIIIMLMMTYVIANMLMSCHNYTTKNLSELHIDAISTKISQDSATIVQQQNTEEYNNIIENEFVSSIKQPLSTFSIDVDEASYSNVRRFIQSGQLPPKNAVRIEEMINYFDYSYPQPINNEPFSVNTEIATCPWNTNHKLVHIGLQGKKIAKENLPPSNLVFLIDVSGSMEEANKLPLVQSSLKMLTEELRDQDKVSIVVYAGNAGLVLPSTSGSNKLKIKTAIDKLNAAGSTAGGEGIQLAYKVALENFKSKGNNRVILCTDGDFNVGLSNEQELVALIEKERKNGIFLTVLGYGMGNYKDNKMQQLADKGNGNHAYIDNMNEARKVLINEFGSTLFTIAKDVKLQVEFNPTHVQAYRLIGYENRMLAAEDFNDNQKDAGELGAGHTVTALYEIIPTGVKNKFEKPMDQLKYQAETSLNKDFGTELMHIKLRYKMPKEEESKMITQSVAMLATSYENSSNNFRLSAAVAEFGLLLRGSSYKQSASYKQVIELAKQSKGEDAEGYRSEFIQMVQTAAALDLNNK